MFELRSAAPVSQRSWVRFPLKPEFFQVSFFQLLKLKHLHCDVSLYVSTFARHCSALPEVFSVLVHSCDKSTLLSVSLYVSISTQY